MLFLLLGIPTYFTCHFRSHFSCLFSQKPSCEEKISHKSGCLTISLGAPNPQSSYIFSSLLLTAL